MKKIRHWLIKKLGGYTEQYPLVPPNVEVKNYNVRLQKISAQERVLGYLDDEHASGFAELSISRKIADFLRDEGYISFSKKRVTDDECAWVEYTGVVTIGIVDE